MSSVITITFSPCIDKSSSVPVLVPEKKLTCAEPRLDPGGGGINVARALHKLGMASTAIFPSGGYTGNYFNHLMEREGIQARIIETGKETRENIIILDESTNNQYRFGMPGTPLTEKEWRQCLQEVTAIKDPAFIVASGSLPPGVPTDIYRQLAAIAAKAKAKFILDSSGEALKQALGPGVYLIKPNLGELATLAGVKQLAIPDILPIARSLIRQQFSEIIVVSMGKDGALLVTATEDYRVQPPEMPRKSTVGAGDSMVAGLVYSLRNGQTLLQALQFGVACGTAATMNPGTELCTKKDAEHIYALLREGQPA